jgi:lia operon protein LiaF
VNGSSNAFLPLLIILTGIGYLLHNLGVIPITPWHVLRTYWPVLLIIFGLGEAYEAISKKGKRGGQMSDLIVPGLIILFGVYLLAPRIGLPEIRISWGIVWPVVLILLGISLLFDKDRVIRVQVNGREEHRPLKTATSVIGEIRRGSTGWVVDDTFIRHGIGSVSLDLTQAIIPERQVSIDISGLIGESIIYLPPDVPVRADCRVEAGDVTVLDQNDSGIHRRITYTSPGYEQAVKKLDIRVYWKIGDVKIRRIG